MARYIKKQDAINEVLNLRDYSTNKKEKLALSLAYKKLREIPTADVAEVKHGEWKPYFNEYKGLVTSYICSLCGRCEERREPYCHCGAKMDGGKAE